MKTLTGLTRGRPLLGSGRLTPSTPQGVKSARKGQQGFCLLFKTFFGRIVCVITVDAANVAAIFNMGLWNALCGPCRCVGVELVGLAVKVPQIDVQELWEGCVGQNR